MTVDLQQQHHTSWCARGHHCAIVLGEHRSKPIVADIPGLGTAVLTRIRAANGREYAEVRMQVTLPRAEPDARRRLTTLFTRLCHLLGPRR